MFNLKNHFYLILETIDLFDSSLTALDVFVYISFAFISATILEFGFVHFFTKIGIYIVIDIKINDMIN